LVFEQRVLRISRPEQHIGQHFAGRDIDLALSDAIL
jgi:hypothetical protein